MKRLLICFLVILLSLSIYAAKSGVGIGITAPEPIGLTLKYNAVKMDIDLLSFQYGWINANLDSQLLKGNIIGSLDYYIAGGINLKYYGNFALAVRAPIGLEMGLGNLPLDIFLEFSPYFGVINYNYTYFNSGGSQYLQGLGITKSAGIRFYISL